MAPPATPTMAWMRAHALIGAKGHQEPGKFYLFLLVDLEDAGDADNQGEERREVGSQDLHEHGYVVENISKESERRHKNTAWTPPATGNIQNQGLVWYYCTSGMALPVPPLFGLRVQFSPEEDEKNVMSRKEKEERSWRRR